MLANRVKETTATTGTGSFTTAGAVAGFQSFNTAFGLDRRFTYWAVNDADNEWETGVAYLSGTTTLVRETVLDNSAGTQVAINFTAAPSLFCSLNNSTGLVSYGELAPNTVVCSDHWAGTLSNKTLTTDKINYCPFLYCASNSVDAFLANVSTAAGSKFRMGLYENVKGLPAELIISSTDMTPSSSTLIEQAFTALDLPVGWYWMAIVSDGALVLRGPADNNFTGTPLGVRDGNSFNLRLSRVEEVATSWTVLPSSATPVVSSVSYTNAIQLSLRAV